MSTLLSYLTLALLLITLIGASFALGFCYADNDTTLEPIPQPQEIIHV